MQRSQQGWVEIDRCLPCDGQRVRFAVVEGCCEDERDGVFHASWATAPLGEPWAFVSESGEPFRSQVVAWRQGGRGRRSRGRARAGGARVAADAVPTARTGTAGGSDRAGTDRVTRARLLFGLLLAIPVLAGCAVDSDDARSREAAVPARPEVPGEVMVRANVPIEGYTELDPERLERERLDPSWRAAAEVDRRARRAGAPAAGEDGAAAASPAPPEAARPAAGQPAPVDRMRTLARRDATSAGDATAAGGPAGDDGSAVTAGESVESITAAALADLAPALPVPREGGGPTVLALQWMLDRVAFSPGVIDGRWGKNTEKAVYWLQDSLGLEPTGVVDQRLWDLLAGQVGTPVLREHTVASADLEGPFVEIPDRPQDQAALDCLCYTSAAEALAERFHTTSELLARLNPEVELDALSEGDRLWVPAVEEAAPEPGIADRVAEIVVSRDGFYLHALDEQGRITYHFPTTVGSSYDPSPGGELEVTGIAFRPDYHFQPEELDDVPDDEEDAVLPPGPNSPVGLVWMQLSKDTYGIHGTSAPASIGYSTSHGCVRLTNWDALYLANRTAQGTPVRFIGGSGAAGG